MKVVSFRFPDPVRGVSLSISSVSSYFFFAGIVLKI